MQEGFLATPNSTQKGRLAFSSYHKARLNRKSVTGTQRLTPNVLCVALEIRSNAGGFFDDTKDGNCEGRVS